MPFLGHALGAAAKQPPARFVKRYENDLRCALANDTLLLPREGREMCGRGPLSVIGTFVGQQAGVWAG